MIDLRFPTALQAVLMLASAEADGVRATSGALAQGLGANPSFVRRLLVPLRRAGIVATRLGQKGGIGLGRPAEAISLRDVYEAVIEEKQLWAARPGVPGLCFVSTHVRGYFEQLAAEAQEMVLATLAKRSITESLDDIRGIAGQPARRSLQDPPGTADA